MSDLEYRIPLTRDKEALVDAEWHDILMGMGSWYAAPGRDTFYARKDVGGRRNRNRFHMHRLIVGVTDPVILVDHVNGNGLDNRVSNLRLATAGQNQYNSKKPKNNSSGFMGVNWYKRTEQWIARVNANGHLVWSGYFDDLEEAARARDAAAIEHHGPFARLNFPPAEMLDTSALIGKN